MKDITTIIVDDEKLDRGLLTSMISANLPDMKIVGEAGTADEAIIMIREVQPELVFLDINMPVKNGFDVVKEIQDMKDIPKIIFVTYDDKYAISAVKCAAFDYLLKPLKLEELMDCCQRYQRVRSENNRHKSVEALLNHLQRHKLLFTTRTGCFFIDPQTIIYIQADGNYSHIHLTNGSKKTVTVNIGEVINQLDGSMFYRISRSTVINTKFLSELNKSEKTCILKTDDQTYSLRYHASYIRELMKT